MKSKTLFLLIFFVVIAGCSQEHKQLKKSCMLAEQFESMSEKNKDLTQEPSSLAYYLENKGACNLALGNSEGYSLLVDSALLGNDSAIYEIASHKLLQEDDLNYVPILKYLVLSENDKVSKNASMLLGSFLLIDERVSEIKNIPIGIIKEMGIYLVNKHAASASGFYSYYLLAILNDKDFPTEKRIEMVKKGDDLQIKLLGSKQVSCSEIYNQINELTVDQTKIHRTCPE